MRFWFAIAGRTEDNPYDTQQPRLADPVAQAGVEGGARVQRDLCDQVRVHLVGRLGGDLRQRGDHPAVAVDDGRDAGVGRTGERHAVLDRPERADRQVHVVLGRAVEPAVVGLVQEDIRLLAVGDLREHPPGHLRHRVLEADRRCEPVPLEIKPLRAVPERQAGDVRAAIGGEGGEPGECLDQGDVLPERHEVELEVGLRGRDAGLE